MHVISDLFVCSGDLPFKFLYGSLLLPVECEVVRSPDDTLTSEEAVITLRHSRHHPLTGHRRLHCVTLEGYYTMEYCQIVAKALSAMLKIIDRQWLPCTVMLITATARGVDASHETMFVVFIDRQPDHQSVAVLWRRTHLYSVKLAFVFYCCFLCIPVAVVPFHRGILDTLNVEVTDRSC